MLIIVIIRKNQTWLCLIIQFPINNFSLNDSSLAIPHNHRISRSIISLKRCIRWQVVNIEGLARGFFNPSWSLCTMAGFCQKWLYYWLRKQTWQSSSFQQALWLSWTAWKLTRRIAKQHRTSRFILWLEWFSPFGIGVSCAIGSVGWISHSWALSPNIWKAWALLFTSIQLSVCLKRLCW